DYENQEPCSYARSSRRNVTGFSGSPPNLTEHRTYPEPTRVGIAGPGCGARTRSTACVGSVPNLGRTWAELQPVGRPLFM
ncbi:MAG: hypothetical protein KDC35_01485, partial [Acidobacteria bacterium]|nr:hypothetical protein [Acidobacteriota bacterium]